jgi:hypothetical protein
MADSKLPLKRRAPVRKRFPTLAEVKSKVEVGGRERLRISRLRRLKKDRMSCFLEEGIKDQSGEVPDTRDCHSAEAAWEETDERRWLKRLAMAVRSVDLGCVGMRRTRRPDDFIRHHLLCCTRLSSHTSYISDAGSTEHSYQLRRRASIVTNRNDVAERALLALPDRIENIYKIIGSTTTRENNYSSIRRHGRSGGKSRQRR